MYTDDDLEKAIEKGIFSAQTVALFRENYQAGKHTQNVDEEDFKLLSSFNDIFVVIACALLLISIAWTLWGGSPAMAMLAVAIMSWGLAEFFVLRRKMSLPAIVLLLVFVGSIFLSVLFYFDFFSFQNFEKRQTPALIAALASACGAGLHWWRFRVAITVAAGVIAALIFTVSILLMLIPTLKAYLEFLVFISGLVIFVLAMRWDAADLERVTNKTDVAFWLHLAAAPLIVHPVFSNLGIFESDPSLFSLMMIIVLYVVLSLVSLVIDRRAFMVSSLVYVLVALSQILENYGLMESGFAYVGVVIGISLLLLSGFWGSARQKLLRMMPEMIRQTVPS